MPSVFTALPVGSVVRLNDEIRTATVGFIEVNGQGPFATFIQDSAIITGWSVEEGVNVQFTHTMGNDIYLNVFGNRMGVATVSGLTFNATGVAQAQVKTPGACIKKDKPHGISRIIEWYHANRISQPGAGKITIKLSGGKTPGSIIKGFLIGASYKSGDPENWTAEYTIQIATVPK